MNRALLPAFRWLQSALYRKGFDLRAFSRAHGIPEAELYGPHLQPWRSREWQSRLRVRDPASLVTPERKYVLWQCARQCANMPRGDFFECGVYKGGTAYLLAELLLGKSKRLHLFDTFAGMPETDADKDLHSEGDFSDASLESVRKYLSRFDNIDYHQGFVPDTFAGFDDAVLAFAHIDLDIYAAIKDATAFIYPRVLSGGIMLYDDYGWATCPGARQAVEEFFADKPESVIALHTGQALVVKM